MTANAPANASPHASSDVEVAWFCPLCDDDYRHLGVVDESLRSSFPHCRDILLRAEQHGFDNILLPSGYKLGIDNHTFAAGVAPMTERMRMLLAIRCGEMWPPQLARQMATLDQMLDGRLTINIISSDLPGAPLESARRYQRTRECMRILRQYLNGESVSYQGEFYQLELEAPRAKMKAGRCPPFYFGGLSDHARDVAAEESDVFLMWPDKEPTVQALLDDMRTRAKGYGRELRFGYRVHVIVRETESQAREAARELLSKLDVDTGDAIRSRSLDHASFGVQKQAALRDESDDEGFVEDHLWTGIGRARSGCGAAIVGDPDQVVNKLMRYVDMGMGAFILSGYPHLDACDWVGRYVLPAFKERLAARS